MGDPKNLLEIIRETRPKAALFTTYTFSVSYFDAVFVPALRSAGCERVDVLVDATEAASSCQEHCSRAAGRIYRIVPVSVPGGGIFHPKVAYLAGLEDDVLSIGSGNLTASGQSLQLECIDAVAASQQPGAFSEFADWLELVSDRVRPNSGPAADVLMKIHRRAQKKGSQIASVGTGAPQPRLIHPLVESPSASLARYFHELFPAGGAKSLVVLSPFHAPDAKPILEFARDIGASGIRVGVDGRNLCAPFQKSKVQGQKFEFVVAESAENRKPLHAKVFEVRATNAVLVMTGSINATNQSFGSRKNIELSLARRLDSSPFQWRKVDPAKWEPTIDLSSKPEDGGLWVDAWLETSRELRGRVRANVPLEKARLELSSERKVVFSAEIALQEDGEFSTSAIRDLDTGSSHILRVIAHSLEATCWVNLNEELDLAAEERERNAAIQRVLRGEYDFTDVAHVIHLLSMLAEGSLSAASGRTGPKATAPSDVDDSPFDVDAWERSGKSSGGATLLGRAPYDLLRALNRWIAKDMELRESEPKTETDQHPALAGETNEQGESERDANTVDLEELFDRLCVAIPDALERGLSSDHTAILVEVAAARALQRSRRSRLEMSPCVSWLQRYSRLNFDESSLQRIQRVACALAAATAWGFEGETNKPAPLSLLRECVERMSGRRLDAQEFEALTSMGLSHESFAIVSKYKPMIIETAARIASAPTLDDNLISTLRELATTGNGSRQDDLNLPPFAISFRNRRPANTELVRRVLDEKQLNHGGCPICSQRLEPDEVAELRRSHVLLHHMGCKKLIFYSDRATDLRAALAELPHAR